MLTGLPNVVDETTEWTETSPLEPASAFATINSPDQIINGSHESSAAYFDAIYELLNADIGGTGGKSRLAFVGLYDSPCSIYNG